MAFAIATSFSHIAAAAAEPNPREGVLLTINAPLKPATLSAIDPDGAFTFRIADGAEVHVPADQLVRWSNPPWPRTANELLLDDGSRLILPALWAAPSGLQLIGDQFTIRTTSLGTLSFSRSQVKAVFWRLPIDRVARQKSIDELLNAQAENKDSDVLALDNGDRLIGELQAIAETVNAENKRETTVAFKSTVGPVELPLARLRGFALSRKSADGKAPLKPKKLIVGLHDGSLIAAASITGKDDHAVIASLSAGELKTPIQSIVALQSFNDDIAYLSDLAPAAYNDEPYLELHWPYRRDRNVLRQPLSIGRRYLKGLGVHSACRLTYKLDKAFSRFAAQVAIDDAARRDGSVVFRVLLHEGDAWREAYASPTVRGVDPAREVSVNLAGADQLALEVAYADNGDELDYADWLDARLERTQTAFQP
jgi:hypothetical protein